jgi:hypothetical protein
MSYLVSSCLHVFCLYFCCNPLFLKHCLFHVFLHAVTLIIFLLQLVDIQNMLVDEIWRETVPKSEIYVLLENLRKCMFLYTSCGTFDKFAFIKTYWFRFSHNKVSWELCALCQQLLREFLWRKCEMINFIHYI